MVKVNFLQKRRWKCKKIPFCVGKAWIRIGLEIKCWIRNRNTGTQAAAWGGMALQAASRALWSSTVLAFRQRKTAALGGPPCSLCGTEKRTGYGYPGGRAVLQISGLRQFSATSHRCLRGRNPSFRWDNLHYFREPCNFCKESCTMHW
jgi:hypothetical protein